MGSSNWLDGQFYTDIPVNWTAADLFRVRPEIRSDLSIDDIEERLGAPIRYISSGPTHLDKTVRSVEVSV